MTDTTTIYLVAGGWGLTIALVLAGFVAARVGNDARMRSRIGALAQRTEVLSEVSLLRDRRSSSLPLLDTFLSRRSWSADTRAKLERAGVRLRVGEYVLLRAFVMILGGSIGAAVAVMTGSTSILPVYGAAGAVAGGIAPPIWLKRRTTKRLQQMELQIVELAELMASMLSSGFGYMQALMSASRQLEPPLGDEVQRLVETTQIGGDADEALEEMAERINSRDFQILTTAITIHRKTGGDLAQILRGVASTIRDRQRFAREVRTMTSRERYSAIIVAGFPLLITGALTFMLPETFGRLFTTFEGRIILAVALALDACGYFAIKRISRIEI